MKSHGRCSSPSPPESDWDHKENFRLDFLLYQTLPEPAQNQQDNRDREIVEDIGPRKSELSARDAFAKSPSSDRNVKPLRVLFMPDCSYCLEGVLRYRQANAREPAFSYLGNPTSQRKLKFYRTKPIFPPPPREVVPEVAPMISKSSRIVRCTPARDHALHAR